MIVNHYSTQVVEHFATRPSDPEACQLSSRCYMEPVQLS